MREKGVLINIIKNGLVFHFHYPFELAEVIPQPHRKATTTLYFVEWVSVIINNKSDKSSGEIINVSMRHESNRYTEKAIIKY